MKRQELEALPNYPFRDFRTNDASFLLLELYWPAVISEALGPEASALVIPLADADQDIHSFGCPMLMGFWIPKIGRGLRVLYNDPPEDITHPHSPLFASASIAERPPEWSLPTGGQIPGPVTRMEELVLIADTDPAVADAVTKAAQLFLLTDISLQDMQDYCDRLEAAWLAGARG